MAFAASWTGSEIFPVRLGEVVKGGVSVGLERLIAQAPAQRKKTAVKTIVCQRSRARQMTPSHCRTYGTVVARWSLSAAVRWSHPPPVSYTHLTLPTTPYV